MDLYWIHWDVTSIGLRMTAPAPVQGSPQQDEAGSVASRALHPAPRCSVLAKNDSMILLQVDR